MLIAFHKVNPVFCANCQLGMMIMCNI